MRSYKYIGIKIMLGGIVLMILSVAMVDAFSRQILSYLSWFGWLIVMAGWCLHIFVIFRDRRSVDKK